MRALGHPFFGTATMQELPHLPQPQEEIEEVLEDCGKLPSAGFKYPGVDAVWSTRLESSLPTWRG